MFGAKNRVNRYHLFVVQTAKPDPDVLSETDSCWIHKACSYCLYKDRAQNKNQGLGSLSYLFTPDRVL